MEASMMWWDGTWPWYGMILGPLLMLGFIVLSVLIVAWVLRAAGFGTQPEPRAATALDVLKERLARGEIDPADYEARKKLLADL
jgi:putative membrane protein